ncbi:major facilitator superfamily domain-containing protein [Hypoxylon sp. FL1284]|nr:major facilitator superfamily domain-containing protein [Hypoxylon sp. FL1284]
MEYETDSRLDHESEPLLGDGQPEVPSPRPVPYLPARAEIGSVRETLVPEYVLPMALLVSLAMASTAATAFFAYATLLCKESQKCRDDETRRFAGFVAGATSISNIVGMLALGHLQKIASSGKSGLVLWMIARSMSVVMLLVGVSAKSIYVALSGRVFEGLASDNLLHFLLNSVYSQSSSMARSSSLINNSLGLYMIGISISPFVAGLFGNFIVSFFVALGLFAVSIVYLLLCVPRRGHSEVPSRSIAGERGSIQARCGRTRSSLVSIGLTILSPLRPFKKQPAYLFIGLSLLTYNTIQSYSFSALIVFTSVCFGFTEKENGFLVSIVHSVAACYIFTSIYLAPWILRQRYRNRHGPPRIEDTGSQPKARDGTLALISLAVQSVALAGLGIATQGSQIYLLSIFLAAGLPAPSFIKAHFVSLFEGEEKSAALAALAMMETLGSLLGPLLLGGLQAYLGADGGVFFVAAVLEGISVVLLGSGLTLILPSSIQ